MMRDAGQVAAVVLAAGASSRMGRPKALLDFDGTPCVARVLGACREGGAGEVVVVTSPSGREVRALCGGTIEAVNPHPERGMLSSLRAGLAVLPAAAAGFLIFPVDYPVVPAREVRRLIDAFWARTPGQRIFIPSFDHRRGHPVLVDAGLAAEFLALPAESSARTVIAAHEPEIVYVQADDDRVLMDMDTPEDYQRCLERSRRPV
jgi:molybdenum cofactor cytidylyltransferase